MYLLSRVRFQPLYKAMHRDIGSQFSFTKLQLQFFKQSYVSLNTANLFQPQKLIP